MSEPALPPEIEELLTHQGWVRRLCRHLAANEVEADEIEQETWRRAIESPPRHRKNLKAWFSAVVRSALVHRVREERGSAARPKSVVSMDRMASEPALESSEQPDSTAERRETFEVLQRLVAELEDPYGEVIFLRYIEAQPPRRIAKKLGIPLRTVQSRLYRGLQLLRRRVHARYGADWRARCMVFVPSLPSVAATTLTTTLAMSKPIKLTLAAAAVLLAVPIYSVLTDSNDVAPDPGPTLRAATPEFVPGDLQGALAVENAEPNPGRIEAAAEADGSLWIRVLDEEGAEVLDFSAAVYRDGEHFDRYPKQGAQFTWPIEPDKAGLVFVHARGRAPFWTWLDPSVSHEIVLPIGRELVLHNSASDDPTEFLRWVSLKCDGLVPTAKSELFRYREHWERSEDPLLNYDRAVQAQVREGHVRFWGLPAEFEGSLQLAINMAQWEDAEHDKSNWNMPVTSATHSLDLELTAWPSWTLQVQHRQDPEHPGRRALALVGLDQVQRGYLPLAARESDPDDPVLETLVIPKTPSFPPPDRVDGWAASLAVIWKGAQHRFPMVLPLEPGDLGRFVIPEAEEFRIQVTDLHGDPVPSASIRATDDRFSGGITDEAGMLVFHSLAGPEVRQSPPTLELFTDLEGYLPTVQSVQLLDDAPAKMVLEAAHGLTVKLRVLDEQSREQLNYLPVVTLRCVGDEQGRSGGLFGRDLEEGERSRFMSQSVGRQRGQGEDLWKLELIPESDLQVGVNVQREEWEVHVYDLNPTHPVLLQVLVQGAELYREEFSVWPTGQLVERDLELQLPEARQIRGVVVDQDGERIPNAFVRLDLPNNQRWNRATDAFGEFDFGKVYADKVLVSAETANGEYLELVPVEVQPNEEGIVDLRLKMQRTRPMQVQVVHADGRPFDGDRFNAKHVADGQWLMAGLRRVEPGIFEVQGPPSGAVRARVFFNGWIHEAVFEVGQEPHVIRIPDHLGINVLLPEGIASGGRRTVLRCQARAEVEARSSFNLYGSARFPTSEAGAFQERPSLPPGEFRAELWQSVEGEWVSISDVIDFDVLPATPVTLDFRSAKPIPQEN